MLRTGLDVTIYSWLDRCSCIDECDLAGRNAVGVGQLAISHKRGRECLTRASRVKGREEPQEKETEIKSPI